MIPSFSRRFLAVFLAASVAVLFTVFPAQSADSALFQGKVVSSDGITPLSGVVVRLVDNETKAVFDSAPSGDEGVFRIDTAPGGEYTLLARSGDTAFLATDSLVLEPGANRPLALTLNEGPSLAPAQQAQAKGLPLWAKIVIGGVIGIAAIFVISESGDSTAEVPASPFQ